MFGCTRTMRNWSAEGKGTRPTHVSMYDVEELNMANLGLDREGMVLVALMSGGDYIPEGVPGCGPKVACEAAKAGYGKSLCQLRASDTEGLRLWKASLIHELQTNESKYFRIRHKSLTIPEDFPNMEVLRYYTHPVVSPESTLDIIRHKLRETREIQLEGLREFARETFNWDFRIGAIKFIRVLSEGLFVSRLHQDGVDGDSLVQKVSSRRNHFSTDGTSELRLAYIPEEIVPIDISNEVEEEIAYARSGLALNSDDEFAAASGSVDATEEAQASGGKVFDIAKPELTWVLEEVARRFAPNSVQDWEEGKSKRKSPSKKKVPGSKTKTKKADAMPHGALDSFVRVTKAVESQEKASSSSAANVREDANLIKEVSEPEDADVSLPLLRRPNQFRRPQTPPSLRVSNSTRRHDDAGVFEAIVISSSPAGDASPLSRFTPPSPIATTSATGSKELPKSIRSILAAGATSRVTHKHSKPTSSISKPNPKTSSHVQGAAAKLRQMPMDKFTQKQPQPEMERLISSKRGDYGSHKSNSSREDATPAATDDDEIEILSSNIPSSLPKHRLTTSNKDSSSPLPPSRHDRSPNPAPIKKLIVPSVSRPGFFDEVEVDVDAYEEAVARESQLLKTRGIRSSVTRWSDVAFIDLTGEHDSR
ncbi:uncharacterized protein TrAFT101_010378 [Trichoderma asperellum]|uniref:uncharacterized protein n=1 Tax=Trichoderma asperellum TaxID=101201 RepID=UPI0033274674|nr:hypothetical protein TrAFT101_010378 [Trichoderma asperellum]